MNSSSSPDDRGAFNIDDRLHDIYVYADATLSVSSISTTATADNLPGPGRLLGNLYGYLGHHIEVAMSRFMPRHPSQNAIGVEVDPGPYHESAEWTDDIYLSAESEQSSTSLSTTATADNLPGAGRVLGNVYSFFGRRLEVAASKFMARRGYGPHAATERIDTLRSGFWIYGENSVIYREQCISFPHSKEDQKVRKNCDKLLKYVRSDYLANRELALEAIIYVTFRDRYVRRVLLLLGATNTIALLHDEGDIYGHLLSPSRKALICLLHNEINTLGLSCSTYFKKWWSSTQKITDQKKLLEQKENIISLALRLQDQI
ncbi:hypothetical protein DFH11DRAFT_1124127 [Phellopilus nigrolimitatus]|nr:hypothetical protein DFH11DRAFT_1124127 [Phellopilus nigrolimitatus]